MKQGDTIKWTFTDEQGQSSHVGNILKINEKWVEFKTKKHGVLSVRVNDGTFEVVQEADTSLDTSDISEPTTESATPTPVAPKSGSKLERAILLLKANPDATSAQLKEMFIKELNMTPAGAQTYVYNAKKAVAKGV